LDPAVIPSILIIAGIIIILIVVARNNIKKQSQLTVTRYRSSPGQHVRHRYIPGQFSDQMELDMRLPYRRFKQLYPETRWTYEEYKKMQMQTAFRRSFSSQDNKRMVR